MIDIELVKKLEDLAAIYAEKKDTDTFQGIWNSGIENGVRLALHLIFKHQDEQKI